MPSSKQLFDIHQTKLEVADKDKAPIRRRRAKKKLEAKRGRIVATYAFATNKTQICTKRVITLSVYNNLRSPRGGAVAAQVEAATSATKLANTRSLYTYV